MFKGFLFFVFLGWKEKEQELSDLLLLWKWYVTTWYLGMCQGKNILCSKLCLNFDAFRLK